MRILYVVDDLDRYRAAEQLLLVAARLPRDQFDVHVCTLSSAGELGAELTAAGIRPVSVDRRWPLDPLAAMRLKRLVDRLKPDVIHAGGFDSATYAHLAAYRSPAVRLVLSPGQIDRGPAFHRSALDRYSSASAGAIVIPRETAGDDLIRQGWPAKKLVVISPGFAPAAASDLPRGALTAELGLPESVYLIGVLGRLDVAQGWKEVIWTLDILRCLRDDVHLVVVGDGPQRPQLERFTRLCTLDSHVHFLGRRVDAPRILPHFNHGWQGPGTQNIAIAAAEALAAGVPVVASDTATNRELVIHDQTGFLTPIGSRVQRARYANRLINDRDLRNRLGEAGRQRASDRFGLGEMLARHTDLYRRVLGA